MKRLVSFVLSMVMMFSAFAPSVAAVENMGDIDIILEQTEVAENQSPETSEEQNSADAPALLSDSNIVIQGSCGKNVTYTLYSDGRMVISGSGEMDDYIYSSNVPWVNYTNEIKTVVIEKGVTTVGECAFCDCSNITSVTIPEGVTSIETAAFVSCISLEEITLPAGLTTIEDSAFLYTGLKEIE